MILSLTVYIFLALSLYILARGSYESEVECVDRMLKRSTPFWDWYIVMSIVLFAVVCGVRYNTGVDNLNYIKHYLYAQEHGMLFRDYELLFGSVELLMAKSGFHFSIFNGFWAAIQITFVYYALRNDKKYLPYVALFIVLSPIFYNWMNGVRQCVVECVFLYLIEYIEKKRLWKYCVGVFLCTLVHKTAILLLPAYFIFQKPFYFKQWWLRIFVFIIFTYLGSLTSWFKSMTFFSKLVEIIGYDSYSSQLDNIVTDLHEAKVWGPGRIGIFLLDMVTIILAPKFIKKYRLGKRFEIYFCAFFWGACGMMLFFDLSHLFYRVFAYYRDMYIIVSPLVIYYLSKERRHILQYMVSFLAYFYTLYVVIRAWIQGDLNGFCIYRFFF